MGRTGRARDKDRPLLLCCERRGATSTASKKKLSLHPSPTHLLKLPPPTTISQVFLFFCSLSRIPGFKHPICAFVCQKPFFIITLGLFTNILKKLSSTKTSPEKLSLLQTTTPSKWGMLCLPCPRLQKQLTREVSLIASSLLFIHTNALYSKAEKLHLNVVVIVSTMRPIYHEK